ncbi:TraR/DksA C4-type zinc finger protein [Bacillus sp. USDA818B3_A]|uniref:TraR/DksA C4-type zinc finger protein n=1 Tax=Bacillus sp. USDA818B3_A TaxID=2698834 RepID=UPI00136E31DB|nr:TraR/DksA C4-type zinc finger protein [Bacillus sp. USDA818B3_A]
MLTANQLTSLKKRLEEEKQTIQSQIDMNRDQDTNLQETVGELSAYDNHPADMGTELFDRARDLALEEHHYKELNNINTALEAMEKGIYGKCQVCEDKIPFERLEVLPSTLYCVDHSPEVSGGNHRPVEEDIIEPPKVNSFSREPKNGVIDTQDSFQEVAQFGTSETPSDLVGDYTSYNEMYDHGINEESYAEDYETYTATDINGKKKTVLPSRKMDEYKELLDKKGIDSKIGDIPYKYSDSYLDDKKTETK